MKWVYEPGKWINGRDVKTEQTKRFEESFVYGEHRPIVYYGQSFGPNSPTGYYVYIGNSPVRYDVAYTFVPNHGAIWSMGWSPYSSSSGTNQFTINFEYPANW